jgi:hypothetical protein
MKCADTFQVGIFQLVPVCFSILQSLISFCSGCNRIVPYGCFKSRSLFDLRNIFRRKDLLSIKFFANITAQTVRDGKTTPALFPRYELFDSQPVLPEHFTKGLWRFVTPPPKKFLRHPVFPTIIYV